LSSSPKKDARTFHSLNLSLPQTIHTPLRAAELDTYALLLFRQLRGKSFTDRIRELMAIEEGATNARLKIRAIRGDGGHRAEENQRDCGRGRSVGMKREFYMGFEREK
jgi:hypothetical protein